MMTKEILNQLLIGVCAILIATLAIIAVVKGANGSKEEFKKAVKRLAVWSVLIIVTGLVYTFIIK